MEPFNKEKILEHLNWRYAVKKFDSQKKISSGEWAFLEESLRLSPSSYGLQPWNFLVIESQDVRKKLREASWNQTQVTDASHFVVLATLKKVSEDYVKHFVQSIAEVRGVPAESLKGYQDVMVQDVVQGPRSEVISWWAQRQTYIAMGNLMNAAALINVDTCPLEGLDPKKYDEILKLTDSAYQTVAAVACGYRSAEDKLATAKKVRFSKNEIFKYYK